MGMIAAGMFLRTYREARKLKREDIATALKRNFEVIGRWERGVNAPGVDEFDEYVKLVNAPVAPAMGLVRDKTASRFKGLHEAVRLLVTDGGLSKKEIQKLKVWRQYGDQAILDAIAPD